MSIDWPGLRAAAAAAAARAYAPYSGLRVGAAAQASDGRIVVGCNVENASYGLTLCAECGLVSAWHAGAAFPGTPGTPTVPPSAASGTSSGASGPPPTLLAVAVVAGDGQPLLPCGRCRQLLLEAGGADLLVDTAEGPVELKVLLPAAFTASDLSQRGDPR